MKKILIIILLLAGLLAAGIFIARKYSVKKPLKTVTETLTITATKEDSAGVDTNSEFVLNSQKSIKTDEVRDTLMVKPALAYDLTAVSDKEIKIKPKEKLKAGEVYRFQMPKLLSWSFGIKSPFKVVNTLPRNGASGVPVNSGIEITFSYDGFTDPKNYFEISPQTEGKFERHKRVLVFVPKSLNYGTIYTVKLKKGLGLTGSGEKLTEDTVFRFETAPKQERTELFIGFNGSLNEFSSIDKPALTLYISDLNAASKLSVNVYGYKNDSEFIRAIKDKEKLPMWARYNREKYVSDIKGLVKIASFEASVERQDYNTYIMFPESLKEGYYLVEARVAGRQDMPVAQTFLQVTDIAAYLTNTQTKTLVWAFDLNGKKPLVNAEVSLIDTELINKTDGNGVSTFETPKEIIDGKLNFYYKVKASGTNKTLIIPVENQENYSYFGRGDYPAGAADKYWSYLYLDRPLYLPSDSVSFWGMVRKRDGKDAEAKYKAALTASDYHDYNYEPVNIWEQELKISEMDTFTGEIPLVSMKPGYYSLTITDGKNTITSRSFSVATYTKPAYKIEIEPNKKAVFADSEVEFKGKTSFYEGTPVNSVSLSYNLSEGVENKITSDSRGEFSVKYIPKYRDSKDSYYPRYDYISAKPVNAEEGEIEGTSGVLVFGPRIGLKVKSETAARNGKLDISLYNIDLSKVNSAVVNTEDYQGSPAANREVMGTVFENSWTKKETGEYYDFISKTVQKKYDYIQVKEKYADFKLTTDSQGQAKYEILMKMGKGYEIEIVAEDGNGKTAYTQTYLYPRGESSSYGYRQDDYYHLESGLDREKSGFSTGENVNLIFKKSDLYLPEGSNNYYLFLLNSRGLRDYKTGQRPEWLFAYREEFVPNVFATGVYFNGITFLKSESLNLPFNRQDRKLTINVNADKQTYKPRDEVKLNVVTSDKDGRPEASEVNLSLIDESLFKLEEQSVDILSELYRNVPGGTLSSYSSHKLPLRAEGAEGGGCFLPETEILMSGGKSKPIEEVRTGDFVLTRENPNSSKLVKGKVTATFKHEVPEYLIINGGLKVTPEHNLFINGRWMTAGEARVGDYLLNSQDEWIRIFSIEKTWAKVAVYNLRIDKYETFFAGDFYVHNQKGRDLFKDKAFFGNIQTDKSGQGTASFNLPDNLTSWRMTFQGISKKLLAGNGTKLIPVKLPFFTDMVTNTEYLAGDLPVINIRSFGEELKEGEAVDYTFQSDSLGINKNFQAKAFESFQLPLPSLTQGRHKFTLTARSGQMSDKLAREIKVVNSRLVKAESDRQVLNTETKVKGASDGTTTVVLSDGGKGKFYYPLLGLNWTYGARIDQKVPSLVARKLIREVFGKDASENFEADNFDFSIYQQSDGGISLFPYSSSEVLLSAKTAAVAGDLFSKPALRQYFLKILEDRKETQENMAAALYGLAAIDEPLLIQTKRMISGESGFKPQEKLLLGLSLALAGDQNGAGSVYNEIISKYGESFKPYYRINTGSDQDDVLESTALAANLASLINKKEAEGMFGYLEKNRTSDILINLEQALYIKNSLPWTEDKSGEAEFILDGKTQTAKVEKNKIHKMVLTPIQLEKLKFNKISGEVILTSYYQVPFSEANVKKDNNIGLTRNFYNSSGAETTEFSQSELVRVNLGYRIGKKALDGCYQISDFLPSGLKAVTRMHQPGWDTGNVWYPYSVNGQQVNFCVFSGGNYRPINYIARVVAPGEYAAENAYIQSVESAESFNISERDKIVIK